jgi:hypothetical protein
MEGDMKIVGTTLLVLLLIAPAMAQDRGSTTDLGTSDSKDMNMDILMQKVKADKKLLIAGNMELNDAEGKKFWPLYDAYQKELEEINQRLDRTIKTYAEAFNAGKGTISNDSAKKLMNEALSVEEAEVKLKRAYADKIGNVLPATKTARYLQIETKIRAALRAEMAKEIPLVY